MQKFFEHIRQRFYLNIQQNINYDFYSNFHCFKFTIISKLIYLQLKNQFVNYLTIKKRFKYNFERFYAILQISHNQFFNKYFLKRFLHC